jgi:hypothetical protein
MAGFYRSKYIHKGRARHIAVTQFQESDARRAFPCMDHPAYKATFDIELEVGRGMAAVSNTAVKTEKPLKGGKRRVIFETTPPMSTYLVFFELAGGDAQSLMTTYASTLAAISAGAVFMGANTYIGNAPNFMVYAIARERGIKMPSFFGFMLWSGAILIPTFLLAGFIFFG